VVSEAPTGSALPGTRPQHLVTLSSLDEDALGEELQVIWELEPGAQVLEKAGLPEITGWDSDDRLEAFLDAVRWGAATNANRTFLQAPFRSGISIEDYQLDPLVRAIDMARANLLTADDYREYLESCYTHYPPEIITAETNGYHDRLNDQHQKNERYDTRYGND
jgi:hypothetical protein